MVEARGLHASYKKFHQLGINITGTDYQRQSFLSGLTRYETDGIGLDASHSKVHVGKDRRVWLDFEQCLQFTSTVAGPVIWHGSLVVAVIDRHGCGGIGDLLHHKFLSDLDDGRDD